MATATTDKHPNYPARVAGVVAGFASVRGAVLPAGLTAQAPIRH